MDKYRYQNLLAPSVPKQNSLVLSGKNDFFMTLFRIKKCYSWPDACCTSIQIPGRPSPPSHSPVSTTVSRDLNPGLALSLQGKKHVSVWSSPWDQCWESVTFWCESGSRSTDPYLWLLDPDPTPDPTPFFSDFKDAKKNYFFHIFSYNITAVTLSSVLKI